MSMARYYFNENPQFYRLFDRIEELSKELERRKDLDRITIDAFIKANNEKHELKGECLKFNLLPWYKKMFYKFKL